VFNRFDDGTPPRRPEELSRPNIAFHIELIFPNLWQNYLGPDARVTLAFAPVDDENTLMYLRFYQKFITAPILRNVVARLAMPLNRYILHQDRSVVETQAPKRPELHMGEKLVQADRPIVIYRTHRQKLIERARQDVKA
jgi:phenylpropionate dioxygenase-like ring-hydroxylating dioxygenase large terminal subunit